MQLINANLLMEKKIKSLVVFQSLYLFYKLFEDLFKLHLFFKC